MLDNQGKALLVLNGLPHVGPITLNRLLEAFDGDAVRVMQAKRNALMGVQGVGPKMAETLSSWREHFDLNRELALLKKHRAGFVTRGDGDYPELLLQTADPPIGLYKGGQLELAGLRCIGIELSNVVSRPRWRWFR